MKKWTAFFLAVVMALSLTACNGNGEQETNPPKPTDPVTQPTTQPTVPTTEPTVPTTQPTEPATQPTEPAEKSKFGKVEGNTYTNSYLGVTCTLDENWHIATAEERAALNGLTAEMISDEELAEVFRSSGAAMDLYAENANGLSLNIMLEDLNLLYSLILSEENYANQTIDQLAPALESMGFTDVHSEKATITFAGAEHAGIRISAKISGFDFYETLVLVKVDGCMATVTAGALGENVTEDILARFTPVEG